MNLKYDYQNITKTVLNFEKIEVSKFWNELDKYNNVDLLLNDISLLIAKHKEITESKLKKKHSWFTNDIKENIKVRESYFKFKKKYPNDLFIDGKYKFYKNKVKVLIKKAKKDYVNKKLSDNPNNPTMLWTLLKEFTYNKPIEISRPVPLLKIGDNLIDNHQEIANLFNDFFINVTKDIIVQNNHIDINYFNSFTHDIHTLLDFTPTTYEEVSYLISQLKSKAATGIDDINTRLFWL